MSMRILSKLRSLGEALSYRWYASRVGSLILDLNYWFFRLKRYLIVPIRYWIWLPVGGVAGYFLGSFLLTVKHHSFGTAGDIVTGMVISALLLSVQIELSRLIKKPSNSKVQALLDRYGYRNTTLLVVLFVLLDGVLFGVLESVVIHHYDTMLYGCLGSYLGGGLVIYLTWKRRQTRSNDSK